MDRNVTSAVILFFLLFSIFADVSHAEIRKLSSTDPKNDTSITPGSGANKTVEVQKPKNAQQASNKSSYQLNKTDLGSPAGPPVQSQTTESEKTQNSSNNSVIGKNLESSNDTNPMMSPPDEGKNQKAPNGTELASPSQVKETHNEKYNKTEEVKNKNGTTEVKNGDNGRNNVTKEVKNDDKSSSALGVDETCRGLRKRCGDDSLPLVACIQSFDTGSRDLTVLVQNEGETTLTVNLTVPTSVEIPLKQLEISKNQTKEINIPITVGNIPKLKFNAGKRECVLLLDTHESEEKVFLYLPSYDKLVTPVNGAYFLILTVLLFGGTWACCKFRKRRWHDGVPYQELEMGLPESVLATNMETAEGWDEVWDDDWDDNNAVKSPGPPHMGNISANGLTSRSSNRDGWEHDWDD